MSMVPAGCTKADQTPAPELTIVPFSAVPAESPLTSGFRMGKQLFPQLSKRLGDREPTLFSIQLLESYQGSRILVAAVDPTGGAFALVPLDPIARGKSPVPVCWFSIRWPGPDAAQSVAGLSWTDPWWPDRECKVRPQSENTWQKDSDAAGHKVTRRLGKAIIVTTGKHTDTRFPPDLRAALRLAMQPGERLTRIVPLPETRDDKAIGWTSSGRTLFAVGFGGQRSSAHMCVISAPAWSDIVRTDQAVLQSPEQECDAALKEAEAADLKALLASPPRIEVVPVQPQQGS
ncbi:hypothetical protein [Novosphingobium aerophilum]|uniref:Uncharacterized protein n=1 Tax=Novosphingobium aerophilum TaxID=2839843 RepID=A0A7X1F5P6_9SPHN|nr:hypothetical protein [Novosphingobium aerophilum]MBC2650818.1 hypothetical protein [Novosphingobium aerophilum]